MNNIHKIVVIGVKFDSNLGDMLLGDCLCYLLSKELPNANIDYIDMRGRTGFDNNAYQYSSLQIIYKRIRHFGGKILKACFPQHSLRNESELKSFFQQHLVDASVIVFAGGGVIEYAHYNSDLYIRLITNIANDFNIPVIFNAVGMLDRFNPHNKRAIDLRSVLQSDNVKFIGVRENISWMEEWVDCKKDVKLICDPACFASDTYGVKKVNNSNLVGIGLIRPNIYRDFGINVSDNRIADIYASIINVFISQGFQCELFTNGYKGDILLADLMCSRHKELMPLKKTIKNPADAKDLVETIARYRFVFSSRMHSAITSYSLSIPCGTLCWADKIEAFYKNIDHSERCFYPETVEPSSVVNILLNSPEEDKTKRTEYLASSMIPIGFVKQLY